MYTEQEFLVMEYLYKGKDIYELLNSDNNKDFSKAISDLQKHGIVDGFIALESFGGYSFYSDGDKKIHLTKYGIEVCLEKFN